MKKHYNTCIHPHKHVHMSLYDWNSPFFLPQYVPPKHRIVHVYLIFWHAFFLNWATENVNQQRYNCDQLYQFSLNYMCYNWVGMCCHHSCELIEGWSLSWRCWLWGQWRDEIQGFVTREGSERGCHWWT